MTDRPTSGSGPLPAPPERGEAAANGIRLVFRRWPGPAAGPHRCPPVLLLHGLLQTGEGMANLAAHLARQGTVVVPDLRGRGESSQPDDGYDPATMADDVAALIETLGLDRPVVIGRLHGGLVGYHLAARRPDLVRGVVLGDTAPEVGAERAAARLDAVRALPRRFPSLDAALAFYQDGLGLSPVRARHDIPHDLIAEDATTGPDGGYRWRHNLAVIEQIEAAAMPRSDWDVLAAVRCPVLLLRGQRGEVPAATSERFCRTIAGCQVQTIYGARHDVFLGPGAEQAFGAVDLFLMRLVNAAPAAGAGAQLSLSEETGRPGRPSPVDDQMALPGAEPPAAAEAGSAAAVVERIARAVNARDETAVDALFAPDGRIVQYRAGSRVRDGGLPAARAAFWDIFAALPGGTVAARDVVATADRAAAVLTVRDAAEPAAAHPAAGAPPGGEAIVAPIFLRLREGRIVEFVSYGLRLPADEV